MKISSTALTADIEIARIVFFFPAPWWNVLVDTKKREKNGLSTSDFEIIGHMRNTYDCKCLPCLCRQTPLWCLIDQFLESLTQRTDSALYSLRVQLLLCPSSVSLHIRICSVYIVTVSRLYVYCYPCIFQLILCITIVQIHEQLLYAQRCCLHKRTITYV